jgi:hypothetical protein
MTTTEIINSNGKVVGKIVACGGRAMFLSGGRVVSVGPDATMERTIREQFLAGYKIEFNTISPPCAADCSSCRLRPQGCGAW